MRVQIHEVDKNTKATEEIVEGIEQKGVQVYETRELEVTFRPISVRARLTV